MRRDRDSAVVTASEVGMRRESILYHGGEPERRLRVLDMVGYETSLNGILVWD
jgi:hypothetical protein